MKNPICDSQALEKKFKLYIRIPTITWILSGRCEENYIQQIKFIHKRFLNGVFEVYL